MEGTDDTSSPARTLRKRPKRQLSVESATTATTSGSATSPPSAKRRRVGGNPTSTPTSAHESLKSPPPTPPPVLVSEELAATQEIELLASSGSSGGSSLLSRTTTVGLHELSSSPQRGSGSHHQHHQGHAGAGGIVYRVSSTIVELDEEGRAHEKQPVVQKVAVSMMSEALLRRERRELHPHRRVAMEVIRLLDAFFCALPEFNYEPNRPSHQWLKRSVFHQYYTPSQGRQSARDGSTSSSSSSSSFGSMHGDDTDDTDDDERELHGDDDEETIDLTNVEQARAIDDADNHGGAAARSSRHSRHVRSPSASPSRSPQRTASSPKRGRAVSPSRPVRKQPRELLRDILEPLAQAADEVLGADPSLIHMQSPVYILGDLHGNYKDLQFFSNALWKMGIDMSPASFLFLGDFVDRGPHSVETLAYLLALKILHPTRVFLLRGNHELESQNGSTLYGNRSFKRQCIDFYAPDSKRGAAMHLRFNRTFEFMPFAATIDRRVFCCHGGIPRALNDDSDPRPLLERIAAIERPVSEEELEADPTQLAMDLMWADPATADEEHAHTASLRRSASKQRAASESNSLAVDGFAPNLLRGGDAIVFGKVAVDKFVHHTGLTHLIRAHQPPEMGIEYAKGARILTVFSSSHYCGNNSAAVVMAARGELKVATTRQQVGLQPTTSQYFVV